MIFYMMRFLLRTNDDVTKSRHELTYRYVECQRTELRCCIDIRQWPDHSLHSSHTGRLHCSRRRNVHAGKLFRKTVVIVVCKHD